MVDGIVAGVDNANTTATDVRVVHDEAALTAAVDDLAAAGGGTIRLAARATPYDIALTGMGRAAAPVTITSDDPADPAVITTLALRDSAGLRLTGLSFETRLADGRTDALILRSRDIELSGNTMTGVADGFRYKDGPATVGDSFMLVRDSADIRILDNVVTDYATAFGILDNTNLTFANNEIARLQGDGIQGGGIDGLTITGNWLHSFYGSTRAINHNDMIQLWGTSTGSPNRNVVIADNVLMAGEGLATQGIFIRNEEFAADTRASGYFTNVTITGNLVHGGATNAIYVADSRGLDVSDNTVLWNTRVQSMTSAPNTGTSAEPWINLFNNPDMTVTGNVVGRIRGNLDGRDIAATNLILDYDTPSASGYVGRHVIDHDPAALLDARNYMLREDSPWAGLAGARPDLSRLDDRAPIPVITSSVREGHMLAVDLGADVFGAGGRAVDDATMQVRWQLDNGTVIGGSDVTHVFDRPGAHNVRLTVTDADGRESSAVRQITLADPVLLALDFEAGLTDLSSRDSPMLLRDPLDLTQVAGRTGLGFELNNKSGGYVLSTADHLFGLDRFAIDMALRLDDPDGAGTVLEFYQTMKLAVTTGGGLAYSLTTDEGSYRVQTPDGVLSDGAWHQLSLRYDDSAGTLGLVLDDTLLDTVAASGTTSGKQYWNIALGAAWGTTAPVTLDDLKITQPPSAAALAALKPAAATTDEILFAFDFDDGINDASAYDTAARLRGDGTGALVANGISGGGLRTDGAPFEIANTSDHLSALTAFEIGFDFRKIDAAGAGGLMTLHTAMDLDVMADGSLRFWMQTDAGRFSVSSAAGQVSDTAWHDLRISYSDAQETLALWLDDRMIGQTAAQGVTKPLSYWGLTLSEAWGETVAAVVDNFVMTSPYDEAMM